MTHVTHSRLECLECLEYVSHWNTLKMYEHVAYLEFTRSLPYFNYSYNWWPQFPALKDGQNQQPQTTSDHVPHRDIGCVCQLRGWRIVQHDTLGVVEST